MRKRPLVRAAVPLVTGRAERKRGKSVPPERSIRTATKRPIGTPAGRAFLGRLAQTVLEDSLQFPPVKLNPTSNQHKSGWDAREHYQLRARQLHKTRLPCKPRFAFVTFSRNRSSLPIAVLQSR